MKRKTVYILLLAVALCLLLTGCEAVGNLSGTAGNPTVGMIAVAAVEMNGETSYYDNIAAAWSKANENPDANVTVKLLSDAPCDSELMMEPRSGSLTVDLAGYIIDRGLTTPTEGGRVFNLQEDGTVVIKNGTVTGGNIDGRGGAFYVGEGVDLTLQNLTITKNSATIRGSAIHLAAQDFDVTLDNVTITQNSAGESGAVFWGIWETTRSTLTFKNKIVITDNTGADSLNNFVYDGQGWCGWLNTDEMSTDSRIGVCYYDGNGGPLADSFGDRVDELHNCFFADQEDHSIVVYQDRLIVKYTDQVAAVYTNGEWYLYNSFAQAWGAANHMSHNNSTMIFFDDWIAENGSLGSGYFFEDGALCPREREDEDTWLYVDLNGHTIDRGLYDAENLAYNERENGCIFYIRGGSQDVNICIENGTLTGGANTDDGGAITISYVADNLVLRNMNIHHNYSKGRGGGVFAQDTLEMENCTVTHNTAKSKGGGVYVRTGSFALIGTINVWGNEGGNMYVENRRFETKGFNAAKLTASGSRIGVTLDDFDEVLCFLPSTDEAFLNVFFCDKSGYNPSIDSSSSYIDSTNSHVYKLRFKK